MKGPHFIVDDGLGLSRFGFPLLQIGGGSGLQGVDIVTIHIRQGADLGGDIPRNRDIDEKDGVALPAFGGLAGHLLVHHMALGARGSDDDVRGGQLTGHFLERHRAALHPLGQGHRIGEGAVGDHKFPHPFSFQVRHHQFGHIARADHHHGLVVQAFEYFPRQFHGHVTDRHREAGDAGLAAHPLGGLKDLLHQSGEIGSHCPLLAGDLEALLDLPQNLRLADHHGFEAAGHPEQMRDSRLIVENDGAALYLSLPAGKSSLHPGQDGLGGLFALGSRKIKLHPVAGGEHHQFVQGAGLADLIQQRRQSGGGNVEHLPQRQGGVFVIETDQGKRHGKHPSFLCFRNQEGTTMGGAR